MEKPHVGLKRNTIDKYYTKQNIVEKCIELIKENININENDLIIEPSAGNGAFIEYLILLSKNCIFYDIDPDHNTIIKQDYLTLDTNTLKKENKIHVIGNPPFGRQSSQARKFIKKSCEFCDTVSFILAKSFKKESLQKSFPTNFHLKYQWDLPNNSFIVNNKEYDVPCVFQIWSKENYRRKINKSLEPINYKFVKKQDNPDISFRRVGVNAGKISQEVSDKSEQSHYFIKFNNINEKPLKNYLEKLKKLKFNFNNTVGAKSISKQELIKQMNVLLK